MTIAERLLARADDDRPALLFGTETWTYRQFVEEAERRSALCSRSCTTPTRPPHVGVLLDNVPDYLFWLVAAALSGCVIVGINSTYRGDRWAS